MNIVSKEHWTERPNNYGILKSTFFFFTHGIKLLDIVKKIDI